MQQCVDARLEGTWTCSRRSDPERGDSNTFSRPSSRESEWRSASLWIDRVSLVSIIFIAVLPPLDIWLPLAAVTFDWHFSGREESILYTVSNPFQEIWISALRCCETATYLAVFLSQPSSGVMMLELNPTGSALVQTKPKTGDALVWWRSASFCCCIERFHMWGSGCSNKFCSLYLNASPNMVLKSLRCGTIPRKICLTEHLLMFIWCVVSAWTHVFDHMHTYINTAWSQSIIIS